MRPAVGQQRPPNNNRQARPLTTMQDKLVPPTTARTQRPRPPTNRPQRPRSQDPRSPTSRPQNQRSPPRLQRNQGSNELQRPIRPKTSPKPPRNQRGPSVDDDTLPSFSAPRLFVRPEFNVFGNPIIFDHPTVEEAEDLPDFRRGREC